MRRPDSPCRGCRRRAPGCHNGDTCPAWGRYQAALAAYNAQHRAQIERENFMADYDAAHKYRRERRSETSC